MQRHLLVVGLVSLLASAASAQSAPPRVTADGETLEGGSFGAPNEAVFKGIPYAAAPVGALRWRPPTRHQPRGGVQAARTAGPSCQQSDRLTAWTKSIAANFGTQDKVETAPLNVSEDCLSLNVWTAGWGRRAAPAPVMVWIHGGSNLNGEGTSPWYDGAALARRGVVVVTINYRLGAFGFLSHPALTAESPHRASGNYGLLDQLDALRWVQRNIKAFGGDPSRVTVFGESAGAIDIMHLMASPLSAGLFHRAIAESGAPMQAMAGAAQAESVGVKLASTLGIDPGPGALGALRARPAGEIEAAAGRMMLAGQYVPGPVVDGWVLPAMTGRAFAAGRQTPVPLLLGTNALEMTSLQFYLPPIPRTIAGFRRWLDQTFGPAAPRIAELYPTPSDADVARSLATVVTHQFFTCPTRLAARAMANVGRPAYLYQFTRVLPGGEKLGAYHAAEIGYVFGNRMAWLPHEPVDDTLSDAMASYWTQFAATGNPNRAGLPEWPAYAATTDQHLELGSEVEVGSGLVHEACDVVDQGLRAQWQTGGTK